MLRSRGKEGIEVAWRRCPGNGLQMGVSKDDILVMEVGEMCFGFFKG
jgi:hypothetical protein